MKHLPGGVRTLTGRHAVAALAAICVTACLTLTGIIPASASASAATPARPAVTAVTAGLDTPGRADGLAPGSVVLGGTTGVPAANPQTSTVYVPIQCTNRSCDTPGHVVDVINAAKCNTRIRSDCRVVAKANVGGSPLAAVIDARTDTVYVVNASGTVSVLNGARCNATVTRGCGQRAATIHVGGFPVAAAFDPATRTLYVASPDGDVFVIDAADCNALTTRGCARPVRKVKDGYGPQAVDVDVATDTVYAVNIGTGNGDTVSVINGAACNGHTGSGCGRVPPTIKVGNGAFWDVVDQSTGTVYVASYNSGTVSVINGARCNARVTSGCGSTPPTVTTGGGPAFVAVDDELHTVFAINQEDDTISAINTRTCDGRNTSGCRRIPPSLQAGPDHGPGYNSFPNAMALIPKTGSAYVVNVGGASVLTVTGLSSCGAADTAGCRRLAPSVPGHEGLLAVDPATDTVYGASLTHPDIDVINGARCHAKDLTGCAPVAEIPMADPGANVGAIDQATRTLYASDFAGTVAVINIASCNAHDTAGCGTHPKTIGIGANPGAPALNASTKTLYVPFGSTGNQVAVVNTAACNAHDTSGCGQTPAVVKVGDGTAVVAVSAATDTVYAPNSGSNQFNGDTVSVINGATCNGTEHSGCGHLAATIKVGLGPFGVAVDDDDHTVYVANNADGDAPGTVSVINSATCNGTDTAGCGSHHPVMAAGVSPLLVAVDTQTGVVYVTDYSSAQVSILNGPRCNAATTSGCGTATAEQAVGSQPFGLGIDPCTHTVYVADFFQAGSLSILTADR